MKAETLKSNQSELKSQYSASPQSAIQTLSANGCVDFENLAFNVESPRFNAPAGLHPSSGGDGTFDCPVEIMLAGWIGCVGVTLAAVAHSMRLEINGCEIAAYGEMDFKGTLAVDKQSPVGLTDLKIVFTFRSPEEIGKLEKLIELTERYCVVHQTFLSMPTCKTVIHQTP